MLGSIAGDIIGSVYEHHNVKTTEFPLFTQFSTFTDDTVLTAAVAHAIINRRDYVSSLKEIGRLYPHAGYGGNFYLWLFSEQREPYNSWGNGSAMRVSPVGFAFDNIERVLHEAQKSAEITHNHPEGIKGAQATAAAVFLSRQGKSKQEIRSYIEKTFHYDLGMSIDEMRPFYTFDVSCQGSVPQAIRAFLESDNYEQAVRKAVSIGGDSDTIACIAGGIAHAFYREIPPHIIEKVFEILDDRLRSITEQFMEQYCSE